ncbi:hypothetical protein A3C37_01135 [Candidatus Peribacteria bacterium RIFCSPHIGHO2_02_FULL_53_20]|nr:MAG: hypothetical protein A3C37_01135 [Candidatus Peribacteria bacterium RIFCSPHIGHO2_02_FULL_53_20]OGJ72175.1 MAG: hypothetical protein A3G69_04545 [Candidatus Peribacteria bacterium RIFCSPLOWO2_12_FULL_53_10]
MHIRMHEKLIVWQESHKLCVWVYQLTGKFPDRERFGLITQMQRASFSVSANIAEGNRRRTTRDKIRFLNISAASLEEVHSGFFLAKDLQYISLEEFHKTDIFINRVSYLLMRFTIALKNV